MPGPNQLQRLREDVVASAAALLAPPSGTRTEAGLRLNIRVGIQYLEAWLGGQGAVPIYNLMEDAATAEISRTQIWQWITHGAALDDGRTVTRAMVQHWIAEESAGRLPAACALFEAVATSEQLVDFLTLPAYDILVKPA
jgi:malate synthase